MTGTYVIVGGGTSGIVLAHKLLENGKDVVMIERGSENGYGIYNEDTSEWPAVSLALGEATRHSTLPLTKLADRVLLYSQGSGVGGTSNINAAIWTAGHRSIFDRYWPASWHSNIVDELLQEIEHLIHPHMVHSTTNTRAILEQYGGQNRAGNQKLYWESDVMEGKTCHYATIDRNTGKRLNMGEKLLSSSSSTTPTKKGHLTVIPQCVAERVLFDYTGTGTDEQRSAIAVQCLVQDTLELRNLIKKHPSIIAYDDGTSSSGSASSSGSCSSSSSSSGEAISSSQSSSPSPSDQRFRRLLVHPSGATGEIILCAGTFESPRILLASGLDHLRNRPAQGQESSAEGPGVVQGQGQGSPVPAQGQGLSGPAQGQGLPVPAQGQGLSGSAQGQGLPVPAQGQRLPGPGCGIRGIGRNVQDHTVLPIMMLGNWWSTQKKSTPNSRNNNDNNYSMIRFLRKVNGVPTTLLTLTLIVLRDPNTL